MSNKQFSVIDADMEIDRTGTKVYISISKQTKLTPQEILDACLDLVTDYCGITPDHWEYMNSEKDGGLN
jgi:hypothetical protein